MRFANAVLLKACPTEVARRCKRRHRAGSANGNTAMTTPHDLTPQQRGLHEPVAIHRPKPVKPAPPKTVDRASRGFRIGPQHKRK